MTNPSIPPCPVCGTVPTVQDDMYYIIRRECQIHVYQTDIQQPMVLNGMQWRSLCWQHIGKHVSDTHGAKTLQAVEELIDKGNDYRRLNEGEIIQDGDQIFNDDGYFWERATSCFGEPAPAPQYTSHRQYRRLNERLVPDPRVAVLLARAYELFHSLDPACEYSGVFLRYKLNDLTAGIETTEPNKLIAAQRGEAL